MEKLQLVISFLVSIGSMGMFINTLLRPSPMKLLFVCLVGIMMLMSYLLVWLSYKEYKEEYHGNKK